MQYRTVGRTDLRVSSIGLGGWLTFGDRLEEPASHAVLDAARACGITLLDLADSYAAGEAERVVGRWLRHQDRSRFVLTSKVFWPTGPGPDQRGLGRKHVLEAVDQSLRNLGTDAIDIYFCHREDPETSLRETADVMNDLIRQGKIRHWATSLWSPNRLLKTHALTRLRGLAPPRVEQVPYNLIERWAERRTLPLARLLGMGVLAFSPLANGLLTGKYAGAVPSGSRAEGDGALRERAAGADGARAARCAEAARRHGLDPAMTALAWVLRSPVVSSALMGASSPAQVERNAAAAELTLPSSLVDELARER